MKNCTKQIQKVLFSDIVRGTQTVLGWLCVPGQYQNGITILSCFQYKKINQTFVNIVRFKLIIDFNCFTY